ncbi:J domain-containing protein, partial [Acinetobacter baumannii]
MQTIDISESFTFFGLEPGVKAKTIKEAYRRYVKEFHPDLFPKGSDEQQMAAEKLITANMHFNRLNQYFEFIKADKS